VKKSPQISFEKLNLLYEVSKIINSTLDLNKLLKIIIDLAAEVLKAEASSLMLIDKETKDLTFEVAEGEAEKRLKKIRVPLGKGIAGWVAKVGAPLLIPDVSADPRFYRKVDEETKFKTKSILCVPLKFKDEVIGVIEVINSLDKECFEDEDTQVLSSLANQAAVAIENARLYQQLLEENLKVTRLKNYLSNILRSTPEGVIVLDQEDKITTFDEDAKSFFKVTQREVIGRSYQDVLDRGLTQVIKEIVQKTKEGKKVIDYEFEVKKDEGSSFPLGLSTSPLEDEKGKSLGTVIVCRDLTETKQLITLKELNKLKSDFVSTVSHELRTPLTSIKGFISTLLGDKEGFFGKERIQRFYQIIESEADRLSRLINDLLDVSRIEAGRALQINLKELEVPPLIEKVVNIQKGYTRKHEFKTSFAESLPRVSADEDKFGQILTNLISNAIKYSPDGGTIAIEAKESIEQKHNFVVISVADEGIGIPKDQIDKLFQRFERIEGKETQQIKGTGIGLSLVKHLVELQKGKIGVESKEGIGSKFSFSLPVK